MLLAFLPQPLLRDQVVYGFVVNQPRIDRLLANCITSWWAKLLRRIRRRGPDYRGAEMGSAVVDFVLVGVLLSLIFVSILQLALVLHVRNILIDAAVSGAQFGTLADRSPQEAAERTKMLINSSLNSSFSQEVSYSEKELDGVMTLEILVRAPLPLIGLFGVNRSLEVSGHAALQP